MNEELLHRAILWAIFECPWGFKKKAIAETDFIFLMEQYEAILRGYLGQ